MSEVRNQKGEDKMPAVQESVPKRAKTTQSAILTPKREGKSALAVIFKCYIFSNHGYNLNSFIGL